MGILLLATGPKRPIGHLLGGEKNLVAILTVPPWPQAGAASMESCRFAARRSLGGRFWWVVDVRKRLHRTHGGFHRCIHISKVFFFRVLDLTAENNPPISGRKKTLSVRRTLRACLAGASAPTRPDVPTRSCRRLPVTAGLTTRPVCPQAPPDIAPPTHRT